MQLPWETNLPSVQIFRSDWPHFYPDFFIQLMTLVKGGESTSLGLTMLLTASEELATPREDIATTRWVKFIMLKPWPSK